MIERVVRNDEVVGLIPICSTIFFVRKEGLGSRCLAGFLGKIGIDDGGTTCARVDEGRKRSTASVARGDGVKRLGPIPGLTKQTGRAAFRP